MTFRESERHKEEGVRSEKGIKRGLLFPHEGKTNGEAVVWFASWSLIHTYMQAPTHTTSVFTRRLEQFHSVPQRSRAMCANDERNAR